MTDTTVLIHDFDGDLKFLCTLDEHMGSQVYWRGSYSWAQLRVLENLLKDSLVFVDVGANQGEFTLFAAKRIPHGKVIAFEPSPTMYNRLLRNIALNGFQNVAAHSCGLWSSTEQGVIYQASARFADGSRHEGLGSLFVTKERDQEEAAVELTTLDSFVLASGIQAIDVIKLDVEGAELHALTGAEQTLSRWRPLLLIEVDRANLAAAGTTAKQLFSYLSRWYRFELVTPTGGSVPLDACELGIHHDVLCLPR